jgi:hypothetical protein
MTPTKKKPQKSDVVRTTIHVDAELWIRAKQHAAAERTTLQKLITAGLELVLAKKGR